MNRKQAAILSTLCFLFILLVFGIVNIVLDLLEVATIARIIVNVLYIVVLVINMVVWSVIIKRKAKDKQNRMDKKTKTILVVSLCIGGVLALVAIIIIPIVLLV